MVEKVKLALVLSGGSSFGISWELGYLAGLAKAGLDLEVFDLILGTSAGARVGAMVTSGHTWEELHRRYILGAGEDFRPQIDGKAVFARYAQIAQEAQSPEHWVQLQSEYGKETKTCDPQERLAEMDKRYADIGWSDKLYITAVQADSNERVIWGKDAGVSLSQALCATGSLPGLWPPTEIEGALYCDGGLYSMENADLVEAEKVFVLSTHLPVEVPHPLEQQQAFLEDKGVDVKVIVPTDALQQYGYQSMNESIMQPVYEQAFEQGKAEIETVITFLKNE